MPTNIARCRIRPQLHNRRTMLKFATWSFGTSSKSCTDRPLAGKVPSIARSNRRCACGLIRELGRIRWIPPISTCQRRVKSPTLHKRIGGQLQKVGNTSVQIYPFSTLMSVDLPAPFFPTRPWTSPASTLRKTSSRARTPG